MAGYQRRAPAPAARGFSPSLAVMVVVSLLLHALLGAVAWRGVQWPGREALRPPAYIVDLVAPPTLTPGRPHPAAPSRPAPAVARPAPPSVHSTAISPVSSVSPAPAVVPPRNSADLAIAALRARQERRALDEKLAALKQRDSRRAPGAAPAAAASRPAAPAPALATAPPPQAATPPPGDPGAPYAGWLHDTLKDYWSYSPYQGRTTELEVIYLLYFDLDGRLLNFELVTSSGIAEFDASAKRAILRLKRLPTSPGRPFEQVVVFNLKDLRSP